MMIEFLIGMAVVIGGVFMCVAVWLGLWMMGRERPPSCPPSKEWYDQQKRNAVKHKNNRGEDGTYIEKDVYGLYNIIEKDRIP